MIPVIPLPVRPLVGTADPADRGLTVGSAVRTERLAGVMIKARLVPPFLTLEMQGSP
jgi:hypothetical protein